MTDSKQKSATIVYRAGTKQGPSFHLKDKSIDKAWLVTNPKLYYCLGQGKKYLEQVCLWEADVSNLSKDIAYCHINDEVIQVELSQLQDSRNRLKTFEEIHTYLKSLDWKMAAVPQCNGGFSLMKLSPMVQAVVVYMRDNYPTNPEELNFHAELKAASQWCFSDDYEQLAMKEVPVSDCRLRIAATETLKTWEKEKEDLESSKAKNMYNGIDTSDESVDEQLLDVIEAIRVLNGYLSSEKKGFRTFTDETLYPPILPESLGKVKTTTTYQCELQKVPVSTAEMKLNPDKSNKNHLGMEPVERARLGLVTLI